MQEKGEEIIVKGEEILEKLKNIKPLSNEAYYISNSTSILNETLITELFKAQNKKIDAIQEKLDSKPDNQKLNNNEQKTHGMNSHSNNNEATNQQPNYQQIGELQIFKERNCCR
jgi:predicted nucleotide-binding protein